MHSRTISLTRKWRHSERGRGWSPIRSRSPSPRSVYSEGRVRACAMSVDQSTQSALSHQLSKCLSGVLALGTRYLVQVAPVLCFRGRYLHPCLAKQTHLPRYLLGFPSPSIEAVSVWNSILSSKQFSYRPRWFLTQQTVARLVGRNLLYPNLIAENGCSFRAWS